MIDLIVRTPDGRLLAPYSDSRGYDNPAYGSLAIRSAEGVWAEVFTAAPRPIHAKGVVETIDGLFVCGAGNTAPESNDAVVVWRTNDAGATWAPDLTYANPDGFTRAHALVDLGGTLVVFVDAGTVASFTRPAGGTWEPTDTGGGRVLHALPFDRDGVPVAVGWGLGAVTVHALPADAATRGGTMTALAGVGVITAASVTPDGSALYLAAGATMWRLGSTGAAVRLYDLDHAATALAVSATDLFVGTADSKVYSVPLADLEP